MGPGDDSQRCLTRNWEFKRAQSCEKTSKISSHAAPEESESECTRSAEIFLSLLRFILRTPQDQEKVRGLYQGVSSEITKQYVTFKLRTVVVRQKKEAQCINSELGKWECTKT